ncbi:hypothetical protein Salat_1698300 [Sesamum alatum]|uniref:Uncharacterized protein n=1 Tax=Sesamum alatum TaxID=300844 RepID=A0AAE1Y7S6_9LAMI|nr:hypothetical protein Salat_1698300 [Sesamum alatum]
MNDVLLAVPLDVGSLQDALKSIIAQTEMLQSILDYVVVKFPPKITVDNGTSIHNRMHVWCTGHLLVSTYSLMIESVDEGIVILTRPTICVEMTPLRPDCSNWLSLCAGGRRNVLIGHFEESKI